jgi:hypothetical protein
MMRSFSLRADGRRGQRLTWADARMTCQSLLGVSGSSVTVKS